MKPPTLLVIEVRSYSLFRNLQSPSEYRLTRAVALFSEWLERPALTEDLTDELVSLWLQAIEKTHAQKSVYGFRTDLLCLWRDCAGRELCAPPLRVRRIKKPQPLPISWTIEEIAQIVAHSRRLKGHFPNGSPRAAYCEALALVIYDTGLRRSDTWIIGKHQVRTDGSVLLRQHKTGSPHFPKMRPDTLAKFRALPGDKPLACPFKSSSAFYKFWKQVTAAAGVRHGAMQQMRRTGATHLAITHRDAVQRYLGHRTSEMAKHYIDESIAQPQQYLPPDISPQIEST